MLRTRVAVLSVAAALGALSLAYGSAVAQDGQEGPPVVVSTLPADGESHVERDVFVLISFSEEMRERNIKPNTLRLYEGDKRVPATYVSYSNIGRFMDYEAILNPKPLLKPKTEYTVVVEGAADDDGKAVKDFDGTPMADDYTFSFTTGKH